MEKLTMEKEWRTEEPYNGIRACVQLIELEEEKRKTAEDRVREFFGRMDALMDGNK